MLQEQVEMLQLMKQVQELEVQEAMEEIMMLLEEMADHLLQHVTA